MRRRFTFLVTLLAGLTVTIVVLVRTGTVHAQQVQTSGPFKGQPTDPFVTSGPFKGQPTVIIIGDGPRGKMCTAQLGPAPCDIIMKWVQTHPKGWVAGEPMFYQNQTFSSAGPQAQQIGIQCARQSQGNIDAFVSCAKQQVVLPESQQIMVDCASRSGGTLNGFAACAGQNLVMAQLNPEQKIAVQCVIETNGQPYAAAGCTATRLTERELGKCITDGFGGQNGCFGDNNDLVGKNGWTARTFNNVLSDIQHGPGPTNDLVGRDGVVVRTFQNMQSDIQNGPGANNDVVGCNGWFNRNILGGHC